jgi:hypothetical protein
MTILECDTISLPSAVERAIARLVECGFFEYGLIGGSWCFPFYDTAIGIKYSFRTLDLDFMVDDALQHRKKIIKDLEAELEDEGFIPTIDYATHLQKFHTADLEIEFLTHRKGNQDKTVLIRPFNVTAQPLPFLNILFSEPMTLKVNSLSGTVRVPSPRSMLLHKMIIAHRRTKESKKAKDLDQCRVLSLYCSRTEVQDLLNQQKLSSSTWKNIQESCEIIGIKPPFVRKS